MAAPMPVLPDKNASLSAGGVVIRLQVIPLHVSGRASDGFVFEFKKAEVA